MHTLEASLFKPLPNDLKENLLRSNVIPVNDNLMPLWDNENKINLLYGSYGSGKSVFIADVLIKHCIEDEYFRCYFGRKILEDVRGTVHKTFIDRLRDLKKDHLFIFSDKPNGSMNIVCKANGNEFIPFGANNTTSLKSIKDPTHFFCEELDQFSFEDFGYIYSRLRKEGVVLQFYGAFNTEKIYQSHWIRKVLFDGEFKEQAVKIKANYYDNHFIDQQDYYEKLKLIANGNAAILNSIAHGEWGVVRTGDEFWKQFDETKHVGPAAVDTSTTIHVSLDENVNPYVTQTLWQVPVKKPTDAFQQINQVHEILSKSPDNNAPKAAKQFIKYLQSINYNNVVFVYGDPSASRRSTVDENSASFYNKYIEVLIKEGYRVQSRVAKSAPEVALSAAFINDIFESNLYGYNITISDRCFASIEDYILVKEDADGRMLKAKEKDKESGVTYEPQGHISDSFRYFILQLLKDKWIQYKQRQKPRAVGGYFH